MRALLFFLLKIFIFSYCMLLYIRIYINTVTNVFTKMFIVIKIKFFTVLLAKIK